MSLQQRKEIIKLIKNKYIKNIAIVMHNNPDGDCIGSAVALEEALLKCNKKVDIIIHNKISVKFAPIIGINRVEKYILPYEEKIYDLVFLLDVSDYNRTYYRCAEIGKKIIIIDHHIISAKPEADYYINENDSSAGITIYKIIKQLTIITPKMATAIFLTIRDDTGNFKNSNTTAKTFSFAMDLLNHGADIKLINSIYDYKTMSYIKLLSVVIPNIKIDKKNKLLYLIITKLDIIECNSNVKEAGLVIDLLKTIENIDTCILFIEGNNNVTIKLRSKEFNVYNIISPFGGGGHKTAAACVIASDDVFALKDKIINQYFQELNN